MDDNLKEGTADDTSMGDGAVADMQQPPKKIIKRKRVFSRRLTRGAPDQKIKPAVLAEPSIPPQQEVSISAPPPQNAIRRSLDSTSAAKARFTIADYKSELHSVLRENKKLKSDLATVTKKLFAAESKISELIESNRLSLAKARDARKVASSAEERLNHQDKMLSVYDEEKEIEIKKRLDAAEIKAKVIMYSCHQD